MTAQNWHTYLKQDFENRRRKNPRYSLRSYAKNLTISPTQLSMILAGKRVIKAKMALQLAEVLGLASIETLSLLKNEKLHKRTGAFQETRILNVDEFGPIASWHYYAILGLAGLRQNVADPVWIAKKLQISLSLHSAPKVCVTSTLIMQHSTSWRLSAGQVFDLELS